MANPVLPDTGAHLSDSDRWALHCGFIEGFGYRLDFENGDFWKKRPTDVEGRDLYMMGFVLGYDYRAEGNLSSWVRDADILDFALSPRYLWGL